MTKSLIARRSAVLVAVALACGAAPALAQQKTLKLGALATLEGAFTVLGQDGIRGMELALKERNYTAGGYKIEVVKASSNGDPNSAVSAARKLVEQDKVQILIGPTSGSCSTCFRITIELFSAM